MAGKDTKKERERFVDQQGQWVDTTSSATKARQQKAWNALFEAGKNKGSTTGKTGTKKGK